jgi:hypothetical protein
MKSSKCTEMLERIKGVKMIILEIILIPLLALGLIAMVFIMGAVGLVDSDNSPEKEFSVGIETGEDFPISDASYNNMAIPMLATDPADFLVYQVENQ